MNQLSRIVAAIAVPLALGLVSCSSSGTPPQFNVAKSALARVTSPNVPQADVDQLVSDNNAFAIDLLKATDGTTSSMVSPYSVSLALAMAWAGAQGDTETQIATAMRYTLPQAQLHPAFDVIDLALRSRGQGAQGDDGKPFRLSVSNASWGQEGYAFVESYLDTLAVNYGGGINLLDFSTAPEPARQTINAWVADQTEDRIPELLGPGTIDASTRLVLTNTVYFDAAWKDPFDSASTHSAQFNLSDGTAVSVPMMSRTGSYNFADGADFQAVELPYSGDELSMIAIVPKSGTLDAFESGLDSAKLSAITSALASANVGLTMPKFTFGWKASLKDALTSLGMPIAFTAEADFTGISATGELSIGDVIHQTFVAVDESGTEAAAATAVVMVGCAVSQPDIALTLDRPFIFAIRDIQTGTVVFLGRLLDPRS